MQRLVLILKRSTELAIILFAAEIFLIWAFKMMDSMKRVG